MHREDPQFLKANNGFKARTDTHTNHSVVTQCTLKLNSDTMWSEKELKKLKTETSSKVGRTQMIQEQ